MTRRMIGPTMALITTAALLTDPYTNMTFYKPSDVDIDHLVPLNEAHDSGAHWWSDEMRRAYTNDMSNHVHLIAVPETADGLARAIGEAHRRYSLTVNARQVWRGFLWQGRFASAVMDEAYLLAAARYVELNPVRARMRRRPENHRWSSARAHLSATDDELVKVAPLLELAPDWGAFLAEGLSEDRARDLRAAERTGRPLGDDAFVANLERRTGRRLRKRKAGRKPKRENK